MEDVGHGALQRELECVFVVLEQAQHETPHEPSKHGEDGKIGLRDEILLSGRVDEPQNYSWHNVQIYLMREKKEIYKKNTTLFIYF